METLNEDRQGSGLCDASTLGPSQTLKYFCSAKQSVLQILPFTDNLSPILPNMCENQCHTP